MAAVVVKFAFAGMAVMYLIYGATDVSGSEAAH
jgi:hypothetical protein